MRYIRIIEGLIGRIFGTANYCDAICDWIKTDAVYEPTIHDRQQAHTICSLGNISYPYGYVYNYP